MSASHEFYMTTDLGLRVRGDCDCKVLDDGTIAISYQTYGDEKDLLYEVVALLGQEKRLLFDRFIISAQMSSPARLLVRGLSSGMVSFRLMMTSLLLNL